MMMIPLQRLPGPSAVSRTTFLGTLVLFVLMMALGVSACTGSVQTEALDARVPELLRVLAPEDPAFFGIRGASFNGSSLAVLTSPGPAIFLFTPRGLRTWGRKGNGPSELQNPADVTWVDDHVLVWDFRLGKITSYDTMGDLVATRPYGFLSVARLAQTAGDTLLGLFSFSGGPGAVVRMAGSAIDTIVRLPAAAEQITLTAPGSPSLRLRPPYTPSATWTGLTDGRVAYWDGRSSAISVLGLNGQVLGRLDLPRKRYLVLKEHRDAWLEEAIPRGDLAGRRDVFKALRAGVREEISFPAEFPWALGLIGDPRGGAWVQRTPATTGQVWTYVDGRGPRITLRFPAGREVLAVSVTEIAVKAQNALGVESVEIYVNPAP